MLTENDKALLKALEETTEFYKPRPQYIPMILSLLSIAGIIYYFI